MPTIRSQLVEAAASRQFVRLTRRFDDQIVCGYVLDVGPRFFLLSFVNDCILFDGFSCLRMADIRKVRPDPYTTFVEAALRKRRAQRPRKPAVSVRKVSEMVESAGRHFPLVIVNREEVASDICWIGRVLHVRAGRVSLLEVSPAAEWDRRASAYALSQLTRLDFGGYYEDALHRVAGEPDVDIAPTTRRRAARRRSR